MNEEIYLAGISGSLRKGSFNTMLLKTASQLLPEGVTVAFLSIADIPLYNADLDLPIVAQRPESVQRFRDMIAKVDGILIASPEYNYSIPGGLKNAIDWASRGKDSPLIHKPVALIGATISKGGTIRMQMDFHAIYQYLDMKPVYKPEVYVSEAEQKFGKRGNFLDETAKKLIRQKLEALKEVILQNRAEVLHTTL